MKEYVYGKNTVREVLNNKKRAIKLFSTKSNNELITIAKNNNVQFEIVDNNFLNKLVSGNHQGVVLEIEGYSYTTVDDIIENAHKTYPLIVMLDGIEDPHNLGAILRTCDAGGVDGVIIAKNRCVGLTQTVAKVSTGAIANVKIAQVPNLTQCINELKKNGYWIYAAEAYNSQSYDAISYSSKVALVVGSEGFGISRLVKEQADFNIKIPMTGKVNSLNVSVATAILVSRIKSDRNN